MWERGAVNRTRGGRRHFFKLRSCDKFFEPGPDPGSAIFQIWESDSCSNSNYNHRSNCNLPLFYLRNDHTDSSWCGNWKVTPDLGLFFYKFLTPGPDPDSNEKRRILPESIPVIRIRYHLCTGRVMHCRAPVHHHSIPSVHYRGGTESGFLESTPEGFCVFLSDPEPESKIWEKPDPNPDSLFNFGSSKSLSGHFLGKNMGKSRFDQWL